MNMATAERRGSVAPPDRAALVRHARERLEAQQAVDVRERELSLAREYAEKCRAGHAAADARRLAIARHYGPGVEGDDLEEAREALRLAALRLTEAESIEQDRAAALASAQDDLVHAPSVDPADLVVSLRTDALDAAKAMQTAREALIASARRLLEVLGSAIPLTDLAAGVPPAERLRGRPWLDTWIAGTLWHVDPRSPHATKTRFGDADVADLLARYWPERGIARADDTDERSE